MQSKTWTLDWDDDEEITRPARGAQGANVLVAEGDDDEPIARSLERDGYDVHLAVSARDVLALLESSRRDAFPCERFDLLVLGEPLGATAWLDLVRAIRARGERVPIVLVTRSPEAVMDRTAASLGVIVVEAGDVGALGRSAIGALVVDEERKTA